MRGAFGSKPLRTLVVFLLVFGFVPDSGAAGPSTYTQLIQDALIAKKTGDLETVLKRLIAAHKIKPSPTLMNNIGKTYQDLGRFKEAYDAYSLVVNDVKASSNLRSINAARLVSVNRYLGKAWLQLDELTTQWSVYSNGIKVDQEPAPHAFGCDAARCVLLIYRSKDYTARLHVETASLGRITAIPLEQWSGSASDAHLDFKSYSREIRSVDVDGVAIVDVDWARLNLALMSGKHNITVHYQDGAQISGVWNAKPDTTTKIKTLTTLWRRIESEKKKSAVANATRKMVPDVRKTYQGSALPWITAGAGLVTLGLGGYLFWDASVDKSELNALIDTPQNNGPITEIDQSSFHSQQADIESNSRLGSWLMVAGGAATLSSIVWLFIDHAKIGTATLDAGPKKSTRSFDLRLVGTTLVMGVRY